MVVYTAACRIEIEVEYYEPEGILLTKVDSSVIIAKDAPLLDIFMNSATLSEVNMVSV